MRIHRYGLALALLAALLGAVLAPAGRAGAAGPWSTGAPPQTNFGEGLAALLPDGQVFIFGLTTAVRYDPATDRWALVRDNLEPRDGPAIATLHDGSVLVIGGLSCGHCGGAKVERYDPRLATLTGVGEMHHSRARHTATTLADGRVLVTGGGEGPTGPFATTELYDPATDTWTEGPAMAAGRLKHTATLLPDGRVLVVGGAAAELFDPAANRWSPAAPPRAARSSHAATLLPDGSVLIIGGDQVDAGTPVAFGSRADGPPLATVERYTPATDRWQAAAPLPGPRARAAATVLASGTVLVAGGRAAPATAADTAALATAVRYDPVADAWSDAGAMGAAQYGGTALRLPDGRVLVIGASLPEFYTEAGPPAGVAQCFPQTGQCAGGRFLAYWQAHGGLALNGYPLSAEFVETLEDGKPYTVQYFERTRLEYHPENTDPRYAVQLGQFGRRIHPADPPAAPAPGTRFFAESGHNLGGSFRRYWEANGGLAQFGYPITDEFREPLADGTTYTVQYFERARFEYHPETPPPYDVLLGQFGRQILGGR